MNPIFVNFSLKECEDLLAKNFKDNNHTVTPYKFSPLLGLGFLGDHAILKIRCTCSGETESIQFFAKAMCSEEAQRVFVEEGRGFHKECGLFKQLMPEFLEDDVKTISDCVPACYAVSDMRYIIFEDLNSKGYKTVSPKECMTLECVNVCLQALSKLHCSAVIKEEMVLKRTGNSYKLIEKYPDLFGETFFNSTESSSNLLKATKNGIITMIDLFEGGAEIDVSTFKEVACDILDRFKEFVKPSALFRNAICHGDLWASNIMFKFENDTPIDCRFVDFQSYRYAPPAQDLMAFIYFATSREFRQKYMENITAYYYEKVAEQLTTYNLDVKTILPYDEFKESCNYYKLFGITQTLNHFPHILLTKEQVKGVSLSPGGMQKLLFESKADVILKTCAEDDTYREKLCESIKDLKEVLIEQNLLRIK